nr:hypothetical protein [uncultured Cetobacterium sp.]
MKKFLLVSVMALGLGTVAMAKGHNGNGNYDGHRMGMGKGTMTCQSEEMKELRNSPEYKQYRIKMQENKLEMMKEMSKENPNFTNVEKLNKEKAEMKAEMKTMKMKARYEANKNNTQN